MNISDEIINRLMNTVGYKTKKELADNLGISAPDLNNRAKSGSIKPLLINLAINKNMNVDYLLTGKGAAFSQAPSVAESQASYPHIVKISDPLIQKTAAILESATVFSQALQSNIEAFHLGTEINKDLQAARKLLDQHAKIIEDQNERLKAQEARLKEIEEKLLVGNGE